MNNNSAVVDHIFVYDGPSWKCELSSFYEDLMLYRHANVADDAHRLVRRQDLRENLP